MISLEKIKKIRIENLSISTSILVKAAKELKLDVELLPEKVILISKGKKNYFFKKMLMPCNNLVSCHLSKNKHFTRQILKKDNIPAPKTFVLFNPKSWIKILKSKLNFPFVVKPLNAAHGYGISIDIKRKSTLRKAVIKAFKFTDKEDKKKKVLVEEYFTGSDLRLLVVGNKVVSVLERKPAYVIGNGRESIKELIKKFNDNWCSSVSEFDMPMCPILIDSEVFRKLARQNLKLNNIPKNGQKIELRWNGNVSTGGRTFDITEKVHPQIIKLAIKCTKLMKLEIAGIDILCKDYTKADISHDNLCVLEVNDEPGLDIHYFPYQGKMREVGKDIIKFIFQ